MCFLTRSDLSVLQGDQFGYVDLGGAYVGATQNHLLRTLQELNLQDKLYRIYVENRFIFLLNVCIYNIDFENKKKQLLFFYKYSVV